MTHNADPTAGDDASRPIPAGPHVEWHKVADLDDLPDGRVRTVTVGRHTLALTRVGDRYGALDNHCPHQGGPLGEGSIEKGLLRCPWHGYDYDPLTGHAAARLHRRARRASRSRCATTASTSTLPADAPHERTVSDVMVETMVAWGVTHVFGMVGHSNLGFADAMRAPGGGRQPHVRRHPPRGRGRVRGVGLRQAHRPARGVLRHRRTGLHQPAHRALRRQGRPRAGARDLGPGAVEGARPRRVPGRRPHRRVRRRRRLLQDRAAGVRPRRAHDAGAQARDASSATSRTSCSPTRCRSSWSATVRGRRHRSDASATTGSRRRPPRVDDALRADRGRPPAGDRRRPRRALRDGRGARARRGPARAGAHDVQGQGPGLGPSPARRRRARPQRHAGRELADERVRPAGRVRRVVLEPHRHRGVQADRAGRLRPDGARALPPGHRARARPRRASPLASSLERLAPGGDRVDQRPDVAERWEIWRAEKARRLRRRPRARRVAPPPCSTR